MTSYNNDPLFKKFKSEDDDYKSLSHNPYEMSSNRSNYQRNPLGNSINFFQNRDRSKYCKQRKKYGDRYNNKRDSKNYNRSNYTNNNQNNNNRNHQQRSFGYDNSRGYSKKNRNGRGRENSSSRGHGKQQQRGKYNDYGNRGNRGRCSPSRGRVVNVIYVLMEIHTVIVAITMIVNVIVVILHLVFELIL